MARRDLSPIAAYLRRSCEPDGSKEIKMHYRKKIRMDTDTPELVAFFQDRNYQFVKDIFMDKEVPSPKKLFLEETCELDHKDISCILNSDVYNDSESTNRTMETMSSMSVESKLRIENESGKDIMMEDEDGSDTRDIKANDYSDDKIIPQIKLIAKVRSSKAGLENPMIVSSTGVTDENSHTKGDASSESEVESGSITHHSGSSITTVNREEEFQQTAESEHLLVIENTSQPQGDQGQPDSFSISSVSCPAIFPGQVPYSGSISLRSNSSTASSHSFAFPILASEWNGSPVRMVKADRRQQRKQQQNWRMCFLCCKF